MIVMREKEEREEKEERGEKEESCHEVDSFELEMFISVFKSS